MSSKKKTTTKATTTNSLPDWLTSPYQNAVTQAGNMLQQPAISSGTQAVLDRTLNDSAAGSALANGAGSTLGQFASGNFGSNANALTGAANGDFLRSNPFAQNGGLDTGYIDQSLLNKTASGDYLTADSNPYIRGVAQQGQDAAQAAINAQFGSSGRSNGSGLYAQLFGQGIANAANNVYAQNYANERQLQQSAQNSLLGANASARENALGRQASAYDAERQRQQAAAGGLLNTQLSAAGQIPSIISAMLGSNQAGLQAGQYQDNAGLARLGQYTGILSNLASPYAIQNQDSTTVQKTSGLGSALGTLASLGGAAGSLFAGGGLGGLLGGGATPILGGGFSNALGTLGSGALPSWLGNG